MAFLSINLFLSYCQCLVNFIWSFIIIIIIYLFIYFCLFKRRPKGNKYFEVIKHVWKIDKFEG